MSFLLNIPSETIDLLNLILNFMTFIVTSIGVIFAIILSIKNKWFRFRNPPSLNDGQDGDFEYLCRIKKDYDLKDYTPDNDEEEAACDRFVSRGIFAKNPTGSYRITRAGKKAWKT